MIYDNQLQSLKESWKMIEEKEEKQLEESLFKKFFEAICEELPKANLVERKDLQFFVERDEKLYFESLFGDLIKAAKAGMEAAGDEWKGSRDQRIISSAEREIQKLLDVEKKELEKAIPKLTKIYQNRVKKLNNIMKKVDKAGGSGELKSTIQSHIKTASEKIKHFQGQKKDMEVNPQQVQKAITTGDPDLVDDIGLDSPGPVTSADKAIDKVTQSDGTEDNIQLAIQAANKIEVDDTTREAIDAALESIQKTASSDTMTKAAQQMSKDIPPEEAQKQLKQLEQSAPKGLLSKLNNLVNKGLSKVGIKDPKWQRRIKVFGLMALASIAIPAVLSAVTAAPAVVASGEAAAIVGSEVAGIGAAEAAAEVAAELVDEPVRQMIQYYNGFPQIVTVQ